MCVRVTAFLCALAFHPAWTLAGDSHSGVELAVFPIATHMKSHIDEKISLFPFSYLLFFRNKEPNHSRAHLLGDCGSAEAISGQPCAGMSVRKRKADTEPALTADIDPAEAMAAELQQMRAWSDALLSPIQTSGAVFNMQSAGDNMRCALLCTR